MVIPVCRVCDYHIHSAHAPFRDGYINTTQVALDVTVWNLPPRFAEDLPPSSHEFNMSTLPSSPYCIRQPPMPMHVRAIDHAHNPQPLPHGTYKIRVRD
eukprot:3107637-Pyramimonas_sp.AAC.1